MNLICAFLSTPTEVMWQVLFIATGAVMSEITRHVLRSFREHTQCDDKQEIKKSLTHGTLTVAWNEYSDLLTERNRIARRYNKLIDRYTTLQFDHEVYTEGAKEQRDKRYLSLCVLKAAVIFSLFSLIVTLLWNPSDQQAVLSEVILPHMVGLTAAAILVSGYYTRSAIGNTVIPKPTIAFTMGVIGIGLSGIIALSVSLPYQWESLESDPWNIAWIGKPYFIMLVRLGALPLVSAMASLFVSLLIKRESHNGV